MQLFAWDRHFSTGMPALDDQHRALIDLFNGLHTTLFDSALPADRREVALRRAFDRLMAYARAQFADEEALMQRLGLDERHQMLHRRQHEQFIINLRELWNARDSGADLPGRMMGFLVSWIGLHILGVDPSMARQCRQIEAGKSAADAYEHDPGVSELGLRALLNTTGRLYLEVNRQSQALVQTRAEMADLRAQLEAHAQYDEALRVANRRYFEQRLDEEVARAYRSEEPLSVLLVAMDRPGWRGAPTPADTLPLVAQAVAQAMKRTTDLVARWDDRQLAVMLPETTRDGAWRAAQRVVDTVARLAGSAGFSASVGVAGAVPRSREHGHDLLAQAAQALHAAQAAGGQRAVVA